MPEDEWLDEDDLVIAYLTARPQPYWLAYVLHSNYDVNERVIDWLIRHPQCDKAVALALYWQLGAGFYVQFSDRESVPGHALHSYDLLRYIENRYLHDAFVSNEIAFDPSNRFGDYEGKSVVVPVSEEMKRPLSGHAVDDDALTEGWDGGLPPEVWMRLKELDL